MNAAVDGGIRFPMSARNSKVEFFESPFAKKVPPSTVIIFHCNLEIISIEEEKTRRGMTIPEI
jgi:hypothetical protein